MLKIIIAHSSPVSVSIPKNWGTLLQRAVPATTRSGIASARALLIASCSIPEGTIVAQEVEAGNSGLAIVPFGARTSMWSRQPWLWGMSASAKKRKGTRPAVSVVATEPFSAALGLGAGALEVDHHLFALDRHRRPRSARP